MASSILSSSPLAVAIPAAGKSKPNCKFPAMRLPLASGSSLGHGMMIRLIGLTKRSSTLSPTCSNTNIIISCSIAQSETLQIVQSTIAKQLSIEESAVTPETKFVDLGADSLDTVEIMMALEENFGVSIGEGGAENISTVQDAADLIEKVKAEGA